MAKAYTATVLKEQGLPVAPPLLILAENDADAMAQAHQMLGRAVWFELRDGERVVFTHHPHAPG